ncbi:MAG: hypothetical protein MZV63_19010 [Marinilabiliales bacterium]|nr:hypothetical protein [Marinilabiliales bacterium]
MAYRGLQFVNEIKGGNIPKEYIPSVEKGFREAMSNGPLAGFPLDSLKVVLKDGSYHPVDSDSLSFEIAAKQAFRTCCRQNAIRFFSNRSCRPKLLPLKNM